MFRTLLGNKSIPSFFSGGDMFVDEAYLMAAVYLGRQGSGKTMAAADNTVSYAKRHPKDCIFIIDWSGSLSDAILKVAMSDPQRDELLKRIVYDPLGGRVIHNEKYIVPMPEYSREHDPEMGFRELVAHHTARVTRNFHRANESAAARNPSAIERPITSVLPNLLELTFAIPDTNGDGFQITETAELLNEEKRNSVINTYGGRVPNARKYFKETFPVTPRQQEFKTDTIADLLTIVEHDSTRARLGYHRPGWTAKEVIEKGCIVLIDASGLITREAEQNYLTTQIFSLIVAEIDKRCPGGSYNNVFIVIDEAYSLLQVPGMAKIIARFPPQYRNKKICFVIIIQTLNQLARGTNGEPGLRENIWSFGNIACFGLMDLEDCKEVAQQFFPFDMHATKLSANTKSQHPIMLNDAEQHINWAYRIQRFRSRECLVRRFLSESHMDDRIRYIPKTRDVKITCTDEDVGYAKDYFVKARGVEMVQALQMINARKVEAKPKKQKQQKRKL